MCRLCDSWKVIQSADHWVVEFNGRYIESKFKTFDEANEYMKEARADAAHDFHWEERDEKRTQDEFDTELKERGY